jgi:tetratricopeptide (TPR) repeat protein
MSLLLNALKEADTRRDHAAPKADRIVEAPTAADNTLALSILEDPAQPGRVDAPQPQSAKVDERLARRAAMREAPTTNNHPPRRLLVMPALLALITAILAGTYFWMASRNEVPQLLATALPELQPAGTLTPAPPAATTQPDFALPEPRLQPATALAPTLPEPELVALPAVQAAADTHRIERSSVSQDPSSLQQAYESLRVGDLSRAQTMYEQALQTEPHLVDAHLGLAALAEARGNKAAAVTHYRHVLEQVPDHSRAWSGLANLAGPDATPALESRLRNLIAVRPEANLNFTLGNVLARQSRWVEAQESYFNAFAASPDNADYAFNLAVALDHLGKREAAGAHYEKALRLTGNGAPVQFDPAAASKRLLALRETAP